MLDGANFNLSDVQIFKIAQHFQYNKITHSNLHLLHKEVYHQQVAIAENIPQKLLKNPQMVQIPFQNLVEDAGI